MIRKVVDPYNPVPIHIGRSAIRIATKNPEGHQQVAHIADAVVVDVAEAEGARGLCNLWRKPQRCGGRGW